MLTTNQIMLRVMLACLPAILVQYYYFGNNIIYNIIFSIIFALGLEYICLKLRGNTKKTILNTLSDNSAALTAILFSLCLPPEFSIIKIFIGILFAIVIAKHIYGGLGNNIFNPAMIGYAVLLISFPVDFTSWPILESGLDVDAITQATPLDPAYDNSYINIKYYFYILNIAYLLGGIYLIIKKIVPINLSLGFILGIAVFYLSDILSSPVNILEQLFLGGTMLGAFFIISDPVTAASTPKGRWIYSIFAGLFCAIIREYSGYPDGVAFGILFMNTWVPLINKLTIKKSVLKT